MSRCFACNVRVTEECLDKPTGRYYCFTCFLPTMEEMFRNGHLDRFVLVEEDLPLPLPLEIEKDDEDS